MLEKYCEQHKLSTSTFCITCSKFVCAQCLSSQEHANHVYDEYDKQFFEKHYADICSKQQAASQQTKQDLVSASASIAITLREISKIHESVVAETKRQYDNMIQSAEKQQEELNHQIGQLKKHRQESIENCNKLYSSQVEKVREQLTKWQISSTGSTKLSSLVDNTFGIPKSQDAESDVKTAVYAWGKNASHELGIFDTTANRYKHEEVIALRDKQAVAVVCSEEFSVALTAKGQIYAWGLNVHGQLGIGSFVKYMFDVKRALIDEKVVQICCGKYHCVALTDKGEVWTWGGNVEGQLGLGDNLNRSIPKKVNVGGKKVIQIQTGYLHTMALTDTQEVYTWGRNIRGQLGIGCLDNKNSPQLLQGLKGVVQLCACNGDSCSFVLTTNNVAYSFGLNGDGQLGLGDKENRSAPCEIKTLTAKRPVLLAASVSIGLALDEAGRLYGWGKNSDGQLGSLPKDTVLPQEIVFQKKFSRIIASYDHLLGFTEDNNVYVWGANTSGQLGIGDNSSRSVPQEIKFFSDKKIVKFCASARSTFVVVDIKGYPPSSLKSIKSFIDVRIIM